METLMKLLRPVFVPLLRLKLAAPALPEGQSLVRHLRPVDAWLTYRYLGALLAMLGQLFGAFAGAVVLASQGERWSVALALLIFVVEAVIIAFALVTVRVDFDLRHYLIGDRSLRVSMGAITRHEATLSYANVQNLEVTQGPVERLFGFKSLTVSTAGVDLAAQATGQQTSSIVKLVGLQNAEELRDLILGMVRTQKDGGLGEPVRATPQPTSALSTQRLTEVRDAALALRDAARAA